MAAEPRAIGPISGSAGAEGVSAPARLAASLGPRLTLGPEIGSGGMGVVYAGTHADHGPVVVKLMHAHIDARHAERFRLEGQALARLRSPHVVRILDWGLSGDQPYLVMEQLTGGDVDALLERHGRVPVREVIRLAKGVLAGLEVVHAAGIVHRDLKPGNVFVCEGERGAVLLDFGVVKLMKQLTGVDPLEHATQTGTTVGTPRYIAPEQASGRPVDHRADLYSFGVVMFRMLTGEHLFPANSLSALLLAHVKEPPRAPSGLVAEVPAALDRVVLRALAKRAEDRFPDAAAFRAALEEVERELAPAPRAPAPSDPVGMGTELLPEGFTDELERAIEEAGGVPAGGVPAGGALVASAPAGPRGTQPMPRATLDPGRSPSTVDATVAASPASLGLSGAATEMMEVPPMMATPAAGSTGAGSTGAGPYGVGSPGAGPTGAGPTGAGPAGVGLPNAGTPGMAGAPGMGPTTPGVPGASPTGQAIGPLDLTQPGAAARGGSGARLAVVVVAGIGAFALAVLLSIALTGGFG